MWRSDDIAAPRRERVWRVYIRSPSGARIKKNRLHPIISRHLSAPNVVCGKATHSGSILGLECTVRSVIQGGWTDVGRKFRMMYNFVIVSRKILKYVVLQLSKKWGVA